MQSEKSFQRLPLEAVHILFEEPMNVLRLTYIEILTLLHDILARYSQKGNNSVFLSTEEAESLILSNINKIKQFSIENILEEYSSLIAQSDIRQKQKIVKIQLNTPRITNSSKFRRESTSFPKDKYFINKHPVLRSRRKIVKTVVEPKEIENYLYIYARGRSYIVEILIDFWGKNLWIYEEKYTIKHFSFETFVKAIGIKDLKKSGGVLDAYKNLMKIANSNVEERNSAIESQLSFYKSLQNSLLRVAIENVDISLDLKVHYEKSIENLQKISFEQADIFLDEIIDEYQLLRKPNPTLSNPPRPTRKKTKNPKAISQDALPEDF